MADNNRNWQDNYRQGEWKDDRNRQQRSNEEEPNYSISENRGYRDSGRSSGYSGMSSGDSGWQSRYERQATTDREGDYDGGYYQGRYGRQHDSDSNRGYGRGISSGYSDFGGDYSSREGSRNLYDRQYQGMGRRDYENRENRLGGGNYDRYGDRGRYEEGGYYGGHGEFSSGGRGSGWSHSGFGNSGYGSDYGRPGYANRDYRDYRDNRGDRGRGYGSRDEERSWWDRTTDEVSSWFGDEEAERRRQRDRYMHGQYKGKGPRNYSRSDERIKEDINDRLSDDPFVDASDIDVTISNGEVTLTGTVDHRSTKRRAEDLAEAVSGVRNVENRLRVSQSYAGQTTGSSGTSSSSETLASASSSPVAGSDRSRSK